MEAVPRLPMISFDMLICTKKLSFTHKIEKYINGYYHEDPASYHTELQTLDALRVSAVWPSVDINSCQQMKKYYCQVHYLKSRFPMEENQPVALQFSWKDEYTKMSCTVPDVGFEEMCVLFNIGALHTKLGADDSRSTPDGMKMACTHFQCAAWTFQAVREQYAQYVGVVIANIDIVRAMELLCLAQAQECILEKSLLDNRKAAVVVKVAAELSNFYFKAHKLLVAGDDAMLYEHLPQNKYLVRYIQFKIAHYRCVSLLYAGQQAEEQQQMGARVAYYQAALDALEEARGCIDRMPGGSQQQSPFIDTITFTWDVVEGKRKAAVNENEFIYHEEVPQVTGAGLELKGASLVKGIPFSVTDVEVSGPDIFSRLIPMVAHEASSIYSEQKASLLRYVADEIEKKDLQLQEFMSAVNVEFLTEVHFEIKSATKLTQELVDRAADMNSRPEAVKKLVEMMSKLSDAFHEVESLLSEIQEVLQKEEQAETEYQPIMGKRPQSNVLIELRREAVKYHEAHNRASESNDALHKAMTSHVSNLKILAQPLNKLEEEIPSITLPDSNIDEEAVKKFEIILAKVEEMKTQRATLWTQFRDEMHKDDITPLLITSDLDMDDLFKTEMMKHKKVAELIKQNVIAQENIKSALTNSYAAINDSRKYVEKTANKRNVIIAALISSYDTYGDLQAKAQKGIEFYNKLENNVTKLYQRVRSTCKVQQEEREQLLITAGAQLNKPDANYATMNTSLDQINQPSPKKGPKLKDYLDTRKLNTSTNESNGSNPSNQMYMNVYGAYPSNLPSASAGTESAAKISVAVNEKAMLNNTGDSVNQDIDSRMTQLTMAQQYWQEHPVGYDVSTTSTYNRIPGIYNQHYNPTTSGVGAMYELPNNTAKSNVLTSTNYIPTLAGTASSAIYTTNIAPVSLNNSTKITDASRYYSNAYGPVLAGSATSPVVNMQPQHIQHDQQINNVLNSNNSDRIPVMNTYNFYNPAGYSQGANSNAHSDAPSVSLNSGITGNMYNSTGSAHVYSGYTMPQTNVTSSANYPNSNPSAHQEYASYTNTSSNYPTQANHYSQSPYNYVTSASIIPPTQPMQYTPGLTYNAGNLPLSSTLTTTTTSTPISPSGMPSQAIASGYTSARYDISDVAPIKSHATGNFNTDSVNYYGQQPSSNYYSNYMCQTTAGYNYYNSSYTQPEQNQSVLPTSSSVPMQTAAGKQQISNNHSLLQTVNQNVTKVSSIDLLAGLDFSINQAPLVPQKELPKPENDPTILPKSSTKLINSTSKSELDSIALSYKKPIDKPPKKEPFRSTAVVTKFTKKAQEFWTLADSLVADKAIMTVWKELQDAQDSMNIKNKSISVARCYPLKNRCPDTLPYDYSRIELIGAKDDYINASKVYDLHEYVPNFIVTQSPLKSTLVDFWDMIWERNVESVVCLLSDSEINGDIYWPTLQSTDLNIGNKVITLQNAHMSSYSTERKISIHVPEKRESKYVSLYQFTSWTGSVIPANAEAFVAFIHDVLAGYDTQKSHCNPILVHCDSGVGRSGCFCTVVSVMVEVNSTGQCADVMQNICRISAMRKNILRDREHLKFTYNAIALFYKGLVKVYNSAVMESVDSIPVKENSPPEAIKVDPLSNLDPLWATKKEMKWFG